MKKTNYSRKLDTSGRLMIPIRLREEVGMTAGTEYTFYIHQEEGRQFICIDCGIPKPPMQDISLDDALKVVRENGIKIVIESD